IDEIAKLARKAKGSVYYHFKSKEELFKEVVNMEFIKLKNELTPIIEDNECPVKGKIQRYLIKRMEVLNSAKNYHETLKADLFERFDFVDKLREDIDAWEKEQIKSIVKQGISEDEFEIDVDLEVSLDVFIMLLKGLETPFFLKEGYNRFAPYFEDLTQILIKGISKQPGS
ncbi:MAG: TetR/AcrR family transcriptional regulator, partial [Bacteroidales bacterium]|nr:TetR/AcrR family transcriptional regulator [Bacteroidales bacterium]